MQSFGLANALLLNTYSAIFQSDGLIYYHAAGPLRTTGLAPLILMTAFTLVSFAVIMVTQKTRAWRTVKIAAVLLIFYGVWTTLHLFTSSASGVHAWVHNSPLAHNSFRAVSHVMPVLLVLTALVLRRGSHRLRRSASNVANVALISCAILGVSAVFQTVRLVRYSPPAPPSPARYFSPVASSARIVWVIFDELSYRQAYADRWPGVSFTNFDRVGSMSTVYSDVQPIGDQTEHVLPSLLQGNIFDNLRYSPGQSVLTVHHDAWSPIAPSQSVFQLAQAHGWNTAVAGFYNPYCMLYGAYLQSCFFSSVDSSVNKMMPEESPMTNARMEFANIFRDATEPEEIYAHRMDATNVLTRGIELIADPRNDFIFLHLPVPHPPGIYDRTTGKFNNKEGLSYANGLAYADIALGKLLDAMQSSPRWPQTTFILNGDHSWRVYIWKRTSGWSAEDEAMSHHGQFDPRPAVIMHSAGQTAGNVESAPVSLMVTHDTVAKILSTAR